jgi:hypothetical protein
VAKVSAPAKQNGQEIGAVVFSAQNVPALQMTGSVLFSAQNVPALQPRMSWPPLRVPEVQFTPISWL